MAKRKQQYDYNAIPDAEYFLRMRYNAPDNANVFGIGGGAGTFTETTQETNPTLYQQQVNTQNQNKFLNTMSENSNTMAGVMGGINNAITVLQDPNASNAQKVFGALGIGAASKIWEGDTSKVDNAIKDAQAQMQTGKNNLIQDASSVSGAMQGLKANSLMPRQRINFTPTYYNNWKELKGGKGGFWKNMGTAALQGAANGSIGGPWGAAGGAVAGILGSVAGLFNRKSRYKKAMKAANERMNYMVNAARGFNMEQDFAEKAANQNLISNGINTQRTLDMANFRAYGGNLFDGGGSVIDPDPPSSSFMSDAEKERQMAEMARRAREIEENPITADMLAAAHQNAYYPDRLADTYPEWLPLIGGNRIGKLSENSDWWERILPYAGTVIDWDAALADPNWKNIGSAGISTVLDILPIARAVKGAYTGIKTALKTSKGIGNGINLAKESKATRRAAIDSYENAERNLILDKLHEKFGIGASAQQKAVDRYYDVVNETNRGANPNIGFRLGSEEAIKNAGKTYLTNLATTDLLGGIGMEGLQSGMDYAAEKGDFSYMDTRDLIPGIDYTHKTILSNNGVHFTYNPSSRTWVSEESQNGKRIVVPAEEMEQNLQKGLGKIMGEGTKAYGGGIDLSPNMMAMQQEKQDNDRLKALNQPFSLGLGNSFNQKMNMFPTGGPIDPPRESEIPSTTAVRNATDSLRVDNTLSPAQKAVLGGATPTDYALAVTKEALDAERAKAKQNTQTVINMLYGDRHGEADNNNRYDFGGTMKNLPSEMQSYETGGTHEQNPYGGIQIGTDQQGNPNLVEQGEFRYGDYIFSDRIPVDYDTLFDFGLIASVPKKKHKKGQEKTYADYAKDLVNKTGDPNDPITKRTNDANLQRLANAEEYQKAAEQGQLALDDSLNEYKSALKNGQSPMYGSMKYNGMNGGTDPMDASSLTNVSRSGTPMMAAYGGNLFAAGGSPYDDPFAVNRYNIAKNYPQNVLADLIPAPRLLPNYEDPNYIDPYSRDYDGTVTDADWLKRAQGFSQYNDLTTGYFSPDEIAALRSSYGLDRSGGANKDFIMALQTDLKNKGYYKGKIDGDFGPKSAAALDAMNGTWAWTPYNANAQVPTNTQFNGVLSKYNSYSTSNSSSTSKGRFAGNDAAQTAVEGMTNVHTTDPNSPQAPVENTGTIPPQTGQMADTTRWQFKKLPTQGKWATVGLNAIQAGADANGFTNPDFNPNFNDANRLERKGEASTFARTNAHIGGYQAPDITDIQSPLAQAIQQQQATNRALQNIGGGRNAAASIIANDYNAGQTMGDIVTKANAQNAANRMAAAEINRGIDQFNAQSDNDMYKDNLNAQINGQQMNLNATQASNENRLRQMLYQDATNRQAHQNIVTNQNQMYNNVLNMIADQAARNEEWNLINSKHNQDFYFDPKTGGWGYKGDSGAYSRLNNALATIYPDMPMTGLSADVQKEWNNLLQSKGGQNITDDEIRWIVDMERNAQIEQEAKREHELKLAELNRDNTAKANGGYISNKKKNRYTNYDYNAI